MKLPKSFEAFMRDEVNLNQTRVDKANAAFDTLTSFLENHEVFRKYYVDTSKQGSLRQATIIKPRKDGAEFDVDMLVEMKAMTNWSPIDYLDTVHQAFSSSARYEDLVDRRGKHRCVTIDYAGDFHVDVVPTIIGPDGQWIMNRETDEFESTDGSGYAAWFKQHNHTTNGHLVRCVRLAKYLRDEHEWVVKSILLTTLLGQQVRGSDTSAMHPDVATTLRVLVKRLDGWLQQQSTVPAVTNPALPEEDFTRHWDEDTFESFKEGFHIIALKVEEAFVETNLETSIELWRDVFGDAFPASDEDTDLTKSYLAPAMPLASTAHARPLTDIAGREELRYGVHIDAYLYSSDGRMKFRGINTGVKLPSGRAIKYVAKTGAPEPYDIQWQVVNTGAHAQRENGLRGKFFKAKLLSGKPNRKDIDWETTLYTGRHWIQCFVINNSVCVGKSDRFYIDVKNPAF